MKICLISPYIYPHLSSSYSRTLIGGAEVQQEQIGKLLVLSGLDVSFITNDFGQKLCERVGNFTVYRSYNETDGIKGLRFFYPKIYSLWKAMDLADADIYYSRGCGFMPGLLAIYCRTKGKKYICAGASDLDFIPDKLPLKFLRDRLLYAYGLKRANAIVVQSDYQKSMLRKNYNLDATVIRNFFDELARPIPKEHRKHILWVSTIRKNKRPELFLELAAAMPKTKFIMIGGQDFTQADFYWAIKEKAEQLPNLEFHGFQPFSKTEEYFDKAMVFVNTSEYEGFSNTFLQALRRGIPIVSYVDPDGFIMGNNLGFKVNNQEELFTALGRLLNGSLLDPNIIASYYDRNHTAESIKLQYLRLLDELAMPHGRKKLA
jgi:glycosyltransferase involved in cell wall biosynthesis